MSATSTPRWSLRGAGAGFVGVAAGIVASMGGQGLPAVLTLGFAFALAAAARADRLSGWARALARGWVGFGALGLFAAWIATSAAWSPDPDAGRLAGFLGLLIAAPAIAWLFGGAAHDRTLARRAALACVAALGFLLVSEALTGAAIAHLVYPDAEPREVAGYLGRGALIFIALVWCAIACASRLGMGPRATIALLVVAAGLSTRFDTDLNMVALALGGATLLAARIAPGPTIALVGTGLSATILSAPWLYPLLARAVEAVAPGDVSGLSYQRRAQMWRFATERIHERPFTGWGFGAAPTFDAPISVGGFDWTTLQKHPHSAPLHVWLETGAVGAALLTLAVAGGTLATMRAFGRDRTAAGALAAGAVALGLGWAVSYGAWREWIAAAFVLLVACAVAARATPAEAACERRAAADPFDDGPASDTPADRP